MGRTARAGCGGRSITLVSDTRRKMMKEVLKLKGESVAQHTDITMSSSTKTTSAIKTTSTSTSQILSRTIPNSVLTIYTEKIKNLNSELDKYFKEERMKSSIDKLQIEAEHAENLLLYEKEIESRPMRTWYQSEYQKQEIKNINNDYIKIEQNIAKYGKDNIEIIMKSASDRAKALASIDDYPLDSNNDKNKLHKLSRKKRRRLEAMKQIEEEDNNNRDNRDGDKNNEKYNSKGQ